MIPNKINKFAVLTTQRSGSNFFCFWLNNHPNIRCHSELFLKKYVGMDGFSYYSGSKYYRKILCLIFCNAIMKNIPVNYIISGIIKNFYYSLLYNPAHSGPITDNENLELRNKFHRQFNPENDKSVGFKLMYDQLNEYKTLMNLLKKECCKIIHLIRNNVLKMYLSKLTRRKRGIAHSASEVDKVKVHVNPLSLLKYIEKTEELKNQMRKIFSSNDYLEITYEDFMENYEIFSEKIFDFLEVDNTDVRIPVLKKLNPNSIKDIILNYDEISKLLKDTPYARFLD